MAVFHVNHEDVPDPKEEHDETGLDLARTVAKAIAGAARNAPRKKRRPADRKAGKGKGVPKASGASEP